MKDKLETLQLENQRLKNENNLLTNWISLISHDTKQIFGNIKWIIEAYEDNMINKDDFFKLLPQIKKDAIKNFSTAQETGEWLKTQYGDFSPRQDVLNGFDLYEYIKKEHEIKLLNKDLSFEFSGDPDLFLITDRILLLFILTKIVDNAIKYSHKESKILFSISKNSTNYILSIIDYGIGIKENNLSSIYSFENSVYEGTSGEIGVGLSLKIVQSFVSLLHGNIELKSFEDQGTTVSIYLPQIYK
jgi:signal transduction histidine kinase